MNIEPLYIAGCIDTIKLQFELTSPEKRSILQEIENWEWEFVPITSSNAKAPVGCRVKLIVSSDDFEVSKAMKVFDKTSIWDLSVEVFEILEEIINQYNTYKYANN